MKKKGREEIIMILRCINNNLCASLTVNKEYYVIEEKKVWEDMFFIKGRKIG